MLSWAGLPGLFTESLPPGVFFRNKTNHLGLFGPRDTKEKILAILFGFEKCLLLINGDAADANLKARLPSGWLKRDADRYAL